MSVSGGICEPEKGSLVKNGGKGSLTVISEKIKRMFYAEDRDLYGKKRDKCDDGACSQCFIILSVRYTGSRGSS